MHTETACSAPLFIWIAMSHALGTHVGTSIEEAPKKSEVLHSKDAEIDAIYLKQTQF
jgi:hypothetical protein